MAADHIDFPQNSPLGEGGKLVPRLDASVTDFWAFRDRNKLVMILGIHPFLPNEVKHYEFPTDVTYSFHIDNDSVVTIDDSRISKEFGGVISAPGDISEDITIEVVFDGKKNRPQVSMIEAKRRKRPGIRVWAGLRADAFIFTPFIPNNIAAIVVEVPLSRVVSNQDELIIWGAATVDLPDGSYTDLGGRALYSQFEPYYDLNALHPSEHVAHSFPVPDVVILDISRASFFPNGHTLSDDVVDIVAGFETLVTDQDAIGAEAFLCLEGSDFYPCLISGSATADDIRFLDRFPWLGPPYTFSD